VSGTPTTRRFARSLHENVPHLRAQWWEHEPPPQRGRIRWILAIVLTVVIGALLTLASVVSALQGVAP
jgi:hypothetical protein